MRTYIRFLSVLAAALICISLASCDIESMYKELYSGLAGELFSEPVKGVPEDNEYEYTAIAPFSYTVSPYYQPTSSRRSYDLLSDGQKQLYDGLLTNIYSIYPEKDDLGLYRIPQVILDGVILGAADISVALRALSDDYPELFWLSQTFSHLSDEDMNYTSVRGYSVFEPSEVESMKSGLEVALNGFYSSVGDGLSPYEREKLVHDYIIGNCDYDSETKTGSELSHKAVITHSVYGALVDGLCVCEGYGRSVQLLLCGLGVDCVSVTGLAYNAAGDESELVLHLWNAVELDGEWYYLDATWDDQEDEFQRYEYFNVDDELLSVDHTLSRSFTLMSDDEINENGTEDMNIFIPECRSLEYNFFVYDCPHLCGFDSSYVTDALYTAACDRADMFTFYIDPLYHDFDEAARLLFKERPQYFFDYADEVNGMLSDVEIDNSNLTYYLDKSRSAVTVQLRYY